jgi:anti-anti-sigma factor
MRAIRYDTATEREPMMLDIGIVPVVSDEVHIFLRGQLTHHTSGHLRAALTELLNDGQVTAIRLDLRGVDAVDAGGIATLAVARRICHGMGIRLRLAAISAPVAQELGLLPVKPEPEPQPGQVTADAELAVSS